jgi:hypothetical protein
MNYRRNGLKVLGLSLVAVLGLMAFMAVGAQANWLILEGAKVVESDAVVEVEKHTEGNLLVKEETNLEILCSVVETDPTAKILLLEKSTIAHGHLIFKTCKTWQAGKESPNCKPVEPILAGGLAKVILHTNGENYVLFEPLTAGGNFTQLKFKEPCALPELNNVKGTFVAECGKLEPANTFVHTDCKNHEVTHLVRQASTTLFPEDVLKYGTKTALIDGIAAVRLAEPEKFKGAAWGGHV